MAYSYPAGCEITDRRGNIITDNDTTNDDYDETDGNYDPVNDASDSSDTPPDTHNAKRTDDDYISDLDDDNVTIILNPYVVDLYGPISGV